MSYSGLRAWICHAERLLHRPATSRTYRFIDYLMFLWAEDQIDEIRASHRVTSDPVERNKVHDMDEMNSTPTYWQEQVRKLHRRVPKTREAFLRYPMG